MISYERKIQHKIIERFLIVKELYSLNVPVEGSLNIPFERSWNVPQEHSENIGLER